MRQLRFVARAFQTREKKNKFFQKTRFFGSFIRDTFSVESFFLAFGCSQSGNWSSHFLCIPPTEFFTIPVDPMPPIIIVNHGAISFREMAPTTAGKKQREISLFGSASSFKDLTFTDWQVEKNWAEGAILKSKQFFGQIRIGLNWSKYFANFFLHFNHCGGATTIKSNYIFKCCCYFQIGLTELGNCRIISRGAMKTISNKMSKRWSRLNFIKISKEIK